MADYQAGVGTLLMTMQSGPQPADFADVRATNLAVVLRCIRTNTPCSRADVATLTGLNKATVSSIVAELIDRRLVRETGVTEHRIGRPATMLTVDGGHYAAIGLEVGADHLTAVALDLAGTELVSWRRAFAGLDTAPAKAVSTVAALASKVAARVATQDRRVLALTVGVPGLVSAAGAVPLATGLPWRDVDLRADLRRALREPEFDVVVDTSANLAATAEHRNGPHAGTANLAYVTGDAGITAGLVIDGHPVRGGRGYTGELGHLQLDPAGPACACGRRGCLDTFAGLPAIIRRVLPDVDDDGPLTDYAPELERILVRARQGERAALDALAQAGRHLGRGLSVLTNLVNPEVILLGGGYVALAPWLLPAAEAELAARTVAPDAGGCRLVASALGPAAPATGGAVRALAAVESGSLPAVLVATR
jgi:predicted NBD/HSP70 family sugar kinase